MTGANLHPEVMSEDDFSEEDLPDSPLASFLKTVKADSTLQEALSSASDANSVADIAKRAGVVISQLDAKILVNAILLKQRPWEASAIGKAGENQGQQPDAEDVDFGLAYFTDNTEQRRQ